MNIFRSMLLGTAGFTVVSLAGFSVWAFGGRWFYANTGEAGLFFVSTVVFLGLSGLLLHRLVAGPRPLLQFYKLFIPAFLAYALAWCACWFLWRFGVGEWAGSFFGTAAFALVLAIRFKNFSAFPAAALVLFILHSAGYFAGDAAYKWINSDGRDVLGWSKNKAALLARMSWGFLYGLGFGAGIGYVLARMQKSVAPRPR